MALRAGTPSPQSTVYAIGGLSSIPIASKRLRGVVTADDLVNRKFARPRPNELWSIDSKQDTTLVINALDMAIRNRRPKPGGIVHADHGTPFTSWLFGEKIRSAGLLPSFGSVGDGLDNAMMESFWSSMQIELLNRKKWKTRVELANAIFEYIKIFYNRQRRHSALGTEPQSNTRHSKSATSPPRVSDPTGTRSVGQVKLTPARSSRPSFANSPFGVAVVTMISSSPASPVSSASVCQPLNVGPARVGGHRDAEDSRAASTRSVRRSTPRAPASSISTGNEPAIVRSVAQRETPDQE